MKEINEYESVTVTLDVGLIDHILKFKCFNRQTYLDFNKLPNLVFGIEEKLYKILHDANVFVETAKSELEGYFTTDESLMLFVCLSDESLDFNGWLKPGRDIKIMLHQNRERLKEFYGGLIPMDTLKRVFEKTESLTPSQCNALVAMSYELRSRSRDETLKFSTADIAKCFRTWYSPMPEQWYEVQIH